MLASHWPRLGGRLLDGVIWLVVMGLSIAALLAVAHLELGEIAEQINPLPEPGWIMEEFLQSTTDRGSALEAIIFWLFVGWWMFLLALAGEFLYLVIYATVWVILLIIVAMLLTAPVWATVRSVCYCLMVRRWGGDLGHLATRLRVVDFVSGDRPSWRQSLGRAALKALDLLIIPWVVNGFMVAIRSDRRHLYDLAAGTQVRRSSVSPVTDGNAEFD